MKTSGTYPSLIGGVSQRHPETRAANRHGEQVNMIADAVRGLIRRPGTYYRASKALPATVTPSGFRALDFTVGGNDYAFVASHVTHATAPPLLVVDKTNRIILPSSRPTTDTLLDTLLTSGVGASTALGRFLVMSPAGATPVYTTTERWSPESNQSVHVAWVRGGAYSRTFSLALIRGNQKFWVRYQTMTASYPATLDTSDLLPADPDYNKKVNDRTNAYNSAALKWAGDALADATPENIAQRLADELRLAGFLSPSATVEVINSAICLTDPSVEDIEVDDGGDGNLMRAAGNLVSSPDLLTTLGYPGKVIKVRPQDTPDAQAFYLEARAKDQSVARFTEVTWEECAGTQYDITRCFVFATVSGGTFYISSDLAWLSTQIGATVPGYEPSVTGDADTAPVPTFLTRPITALGTFQDRLVVSAGPHTTSSRPGDYLNFFRASLLSVSPSDPVSFGIIGGEDDTLQHMTVWDRNLFMTGAKRPYVVSGRAPFTPGTVSATAVADLPAIDDTPPVPMGNFLFYARRGDGSASVHQLRPGRSLETPLTEELTEELDDYLAGDPVELRGNATPGYLFLRTDSGSSLYVYQFDDGEDGRRMRGAWHRWAFTGDLMAAWVHNGELQTVLRRTTREGVRAILDTMNMEEHGGPYLDSRVTGDLSPGIAHPAGAMAVDTGNLSGTLAGYMAVASFTYEYNAWPEVQFTDTSIGSPTSWLWDFGDGSTSTLQNPTHSYADYGTYTVTLTVNGGSEATDSVYITFVEDFEVGNQSNYTQTAGDMAVNLPITGVGEYEGAWALVSGNASAPPARMERTIPNGGVATTTLQFFVKIGTQGGVFQDDATAISLYNNATSTIGLSLNPKREEVGDLNRRPLLSVGTGLVSGGATVFFGSTQLVADVWHRVTLTFSTTSACTYAVVRMDTLASVASGTFGTALVIPTFDRLAFFQDISVGSWTACPTSYDYITLN